MGHEDAKALREVVGYEPFSANSDFAYSVQEPVARSTESARAA